MRIKFAGSDTIWGVTKEDLRFTFLDAATNTVGTLRVSNGGNNNVGGQMNVPVRTDGTVYFPLTQIRDGNQTAELGNRLSETANYQDLAIEYIEFSASSSRWDFAIGEIALVRQANNAVTTDVLDFTANEQHNVVMYNTWYDNVKLVVNGTEATQTADGAYEADLGAMGKVRIPSDKVFAYDPVMVSSDLAEGYGITAVATSAEGKEIQQRGEEADNLTSSAYNKDRSALLAGYTYEGEYFLRKGNHGLYPGGSDDTATLGTDPLNATINVTVSPLVALDITGEADGVDIYYFRLGTLAKYDCVVANNNYTDMPDDGSDGTLWLKPDEAAAVLVIPKAGYDFTGVRLDGTELTSEEERADAETNRVSMAVYMITVGENATLEVLGLGGSYANFRMGACCFSHSAGAWGSHARKTACLSFTAPTAKPGQSLRSSARKTAGRSTQRTSMSTAMSLLPISPNTTAVIWIPTVMRSSAVTAAAAGSGRNCPFSAIRLYFCGERSVRRTA